MKVANLTLNYGGSLISIVRYLDIFWVDQK